METVWSIPIVLDISEKDSRKIRDEKEVLLVDHQQRPVALLRDIQVYPYEKDLFATGVFGTKDRNHPGVVSIYHMREFLVGGDIELLGDSRELFPEYSFSPHQTRQIFQKQGWKKVVAFQTRNVPHRGHEFLQKRALREVDGLFISPYRKIRDKIRKETTNFIEVFCNCPLEVCEKRDKKGLHQKARRGEIQNFTGISDPYEAPEKLEINLKTDKETIEESINKVVNYLKEKYLGC